MPERILTRMVKGKMVEIPIPFFEGKEFPSIRNPDAAVRSKITLPRLKFMEKKNDL